MEEMVLNVIKIFTLGFLGFLLAFFSTPALSYLLYKFKLWPKQTRQKSIEGAGLSVIPKYHEERETLVPRCGGVLIWLTMLFLIFLFFGLSRIDGWRLQKLNFLSRSQTWLPLFALVSASLLGLADDLLRIFGKGRYIGGGLSLKVRLTIVVLIGLVGGWWFFAKLGWHTLHIPGVGDFFLGFWYIPLFVLVMLATYSGGVIDGLDGLAGGALAAIFGAFAAIAFFQGQIDIASFAAVLVGALLAFLWFNIPPARFYMGETGILGLLSALTVIVFLTDSVLVLPIIGFLLVVESGSVILQQLSKRFRGKKLFLAAPLHHHFEAAGWPHYKITMRFWVVGVVMAIIGIAIRLLG